MKRLHKTEFIVLLLILFASLFKVSPKIQDNAVAEEVFIEAHQFGWYIHRIDGSVTENYTELYVNQTYSFVVTSLDTGIGSGHSLSINNGGVSVSIPANPGLNNSAMVTFKQIGIFNDGCGTPCGVGHGTMTGDLKLNITATLIVPQPQTVTVTTGVDTVTQNQTITQNQTVYQPTTVTATKTQQVTSTQEKSVVVTQTAPGLLLPIVLTSLIVMIVVSKCLLKDLKKGKF